MAKTMEFGHSECNRVKYVLSGWLALRSVFQGLMDYVVKLTWLMGVTAQTVMTLPCVKTPLTASSASAL